MEKTDKRQILETEFKLLWEELGKDTNMLVLTNKTNERLEDGIQKLKTIKTAFKILFSEESNHNLAIALLANEFQEEDG